MRRILAVVFCFAGLCMAGVVSKQYKVDSTFTNIWNSMGRDAEGNIYVAAGHRNWDYLSPKKDVAFFKFNFKKDVFEKVGTVRDASERIGNWVSADAFPAKPFDAAGKVHTSLRYYKGKMYFATATTMDVAPYTSELEFYPKFFRGSHLYSYDTKTGVIEDMNKNKTVFAPASGIQDIAIDYHHNAIFGIGYPTGKIFKFDLSTGESREIWQCPDGIPNHNGGSISRNLIVDNQGILWFANGHKLIGYIDHLNEISDSLDEPKIRFPNNESAYTGHFMAMAYSASRDSIYFQRQEINKIYRFRVKARKIDFIADAITSSLLLRWDLNKLYWIAGEKSDFKLYEYNIISGKTSVISVGGDGISKAFSGNGDAVDKYGNLWFTNKTATESTVLKVNIGEPCSICDKEIFDYGASPRKYKHDWPKREETPSSF